ncbi:hypothetical protein LCGC14_0632830 [marine sediment metagenome]|uniref:Uncharacterized protein n=1 Tax=marine sediment metagenome TaxID=412755 RepID=A0A0F9RKY0_9ZZZZ
MLKEKEKMILKNCEYCNEKIENPTSNGQKYHKKCFIKNRKRYLNRFRFENKEYFKNTDKKRHQKYPEKLLARNKSRTIKKNSSCEICGLKKELEKHHPDYSKPLHIITLCKKCHRRIHNDNS